MTDYYVDMRGLTPTQREATMRLIKIRYGAFADEMLIKDIAYKYPGFVYTAWDDDCKYMSWHSEDDEFIEDAVRVRIRGHLTNLGRML